MTKHVTLFGRKMRLADSGITYVLGTARLFRFRDDRVTGRFCWKGMCDGHWSEHRASPHAAARALERKIVAAHRRLGKLMGIGGGK